MARSRNLNKRKNRIWTEISGTTFSTFPSGVTIDNSGVITAAGTVSPTELSYLDGAAGDAITYTSGAGYVIVAGSQTWAGTTLQINHGLTTLTGLVATWHTVTATLTAGVSGYAHIIRSAGGDINGTASAVVTQLMYDGGSLSATPQLQKAGGTISWMAFGT